MISSIATALVLQKMRMDFIAHFIELPNVSAYSSTAEEALVELKIVWKAMKESYHKHNEPTPVAAKKRIQQPHV